MKFEDFYKNKKVLVTGHTGFKGSWLSLWLLKLGADVVGYALDPYTSKDNFVVSGLSEKMEDIRGDIRDFEKFNSVVKKYKPEIIFHLAAQAILRLSYEIPKETIETNVMGTENVLEAFRKSDSAKTLVVITSDKCYENKEWIWGYREIDPVGGYDPYSASKGAAEIITSAYIRSFFNPKNYKIHGKVVSTVRAGNVIGGGDWGKDRIIPDAIRALENGKPIEVRNPNSVRPWQFVLEPLNGYLLLASKMHEDPEIFSGPWNFGPNPDSIITVKEVVEKVLKYYGKGNWVRTNKYDEFHESTLLNLDTSKARYLLGWKPELNIDEAIKMTVEWYKNYHDKNIKKIINDQIERFMGDI
ncbi:MAG: CDP-glucose 4,6-dehydratase [Candidatus Nanopusillus acidilobi]